VTDFVVGLGLVFVIEGLLYALFPTQVLNWLEKLRAADMESLRIGGMIMAIMGLGIVWLVRG